MGAARRTALAAVAAAVAASAIARESTALPSPYALAGSGALAVPAVPQAAGRFVLRAGVESTGTASLQQAGGRFALAATASASSLVCYNDTLFRDSFDGSGL